MNKYCGKALSCEETKEIYNKAIDDFADKIQWEYLNGCGIEQREKDFLVAVSNQVAERLKRE